MSATFVVLPVLAGVAALLNVYTSFRLIRSDAFDQGQRIGQFVLVWLLPLVGALLVLHFLRENEMQEPEKPWSPQEEMNPQLEQVLRATVRRGARSARNKIESDVVESEHHSGGSAESAD